MPSLRLRTTACRASANGCTPSSAGWIRWSPLKVLGRGYSITRLADGHVVHDVAQAPPGTPIRITLEGEQELDAEVKAARKPRS